MSKATTGFAAGELRLLMAFAGAMLASVAYPADWSASKEIALGGVYTDNLFLTDTGTEGDWVTVVTPGIVLRGEGRDAKLDLAYAPQYINYAAGDADDKLYNRLQADASAELARNRLFVDARATAGQALINSFGPSGGDVINPTGNVQTAYTYAIAPTYRNRFKNRAEIEARYENNGVFYSKEGEDSVANLIDLQLRSGPAFGNSVWGAVLTGQNVKYERSSTSRFRNIGVFGGYQLNRQWLGDATVGYEDNEYDSIDPKTNGLRWDVSGTWTPNVRTLLELGIGRRYFGWTPLMTFSHRSKRSLWTASYRRDLSSTRAERAQFNVATFEDGSDGSVTGEPVTEEPVTGEPAEIAPGETTPSSSTFVSDVFQVGYNIETRRSKLGASAAYVLRDYQDSPRDESTAWARVFWDRRLSAVTTANLSLMWGWQKNDGRLEQDPSTEYTDWTVTIGLTRKLSERTDVGLWYRFRDRNSDIAGDNYRENRINLALRAVWSD